jgi:hypothetical protein
MLLRTIAGRFFSCDGEVLLGRQNPQLVMGSVDLMNEYVPNR